MGGRLKNILDPFPGERDHSKIRLKGQGHEMNTYLKAYKIESLLSLHAQLVFQIFWLPQKEKNKFKDFAGFFEKLTNSKECSGIRIIISVPAFL